MFRYTYAPNGANNVKLPSQLCRSSRYSCSSVADPSGPHIHSEGPIGITHDTGQSPGLSEPSTPLPSSEHIPGLHCQLQWGVG